MTSRETAQSADTLIGAAQKLEAAAKRLKADARSIRAGNLHPSIDPIQWRDHKVADVKRAAEAALLELGIRVSLVEVAPWSEPIATEVQA